MQLVALGDEETLSAFSSPELPGARGGGTTSPTVVIAAFSRQVLFAWTGRPDTAEHAHLVLTLLIVGTCLNGLMNFPSSLQIAHGWTRLIVGVNALAVLVIVPLEGFGARRWGARGAAVGWLILNASYVLFVVPLMHRRLLRGQHWRWYREDVLAPGLGALLVGLLARLVTPPTPRDRGRWSSWPWSTPWPRASRRSRCRSRGRRCAPRCTGCGSGGRRRRAAL